MKHHTRRSVILLACLLAAVFVLMALAHGIQTDGGKITVTEGSIDSNAGKLTYKLYVPATATAESPAPGVLLLHGYQNDHETCAAYAIELARRGVVVMALDEYGHGSSEPGLKERGYVNHRVKVNFGQESKEEGTFVEVSGPSRFRLMMNFSNLTFFHETYSADSDGNTIVDSSCGGIAAYAVLAGMDMVDPGRLGLSGHSMGTWSSWSVAAAFSGMTNAQGVDITPKATVLQCGELFRESVYDSQNIIFRNVLLLQAKYDEFSYFRDYENVVDNSLLTSPLRTEFLGCTPEEAAWNKTFGSISDGTARRMELLMTNHRLTTHDPNGLAASMAWFRESLGLTTGLKDTDQVAMGKEWLVFAAMLCAIGAMLPLMDILLKVPFFGKLVQPLPDQEGIAPKGRWWRNAAITMAIAGLSYPFMTQLGHGLFPFPEGIFRMTIGNGFACWYILLIAVMLVTMILSCRKAKKQGLGVYHSMGLGAAETPDRLSWSLMGRGAALAGCMVLMMYLLVMLCQTFFMLDFRFIWPFFKTFTGERFLQFLVYLPIFALFFLLNNSKIFASMRTEGTYRPGVKGFVACWWRYALLMIGGVLFITLLEYIPFFMDIGPGADLLFSSTFGGPFMSILIAFVPQVLVFSLLGTWIYRRTGNVYTGAFTIAALACWIVTGGSAML